MKVYAYSKKGNIVGTAKITTVPGKGWGNGYIQVSDFKAGR